jgi:FkbM family methyltransferase
MRQSIPRSIFEFLRKRNIEAKLQRAVPDDYWRAACLNAGIAFSKVRVERDDALTVNFQHASITLPKSAAAVSVLGAHAILEQLSNNTSASLKWDAGMDHLNISFGNARYHASSYGEIHTVGELYLNGDYDFALPENALMLDVGANVGFTSIFLAHLHPRVMIEAFEPLSANYRTALSNIARNPEIRDRVALSNFGLFSTDGVQDIFTEDQNPGMSSLVIDRRELAQHAVDVQQVEVRRASTVLESLKSAHPDRQIVLKLDCEGSEYEILKDLIGTGAIRHVHLAVMEWHRVTGDKDEVDRLRTMMLDSGFGVYFRGRFNAAERANMAVCWRAAVPITTGVAS